MRPKILRVLFALGLLTAALVVGAPPSSAQRGVQLVTPYPAVTIQAGKTVSLNIEAITPARTRVNLGVAEAPPGWQVVFRGGGFAVNSVFGAPTTPPTLQLEIKVPPETAQGDYRVVVTGEAGGATDTLTVGVRISESAAGAITLNPEFPSLRGAATDTFRFSVTLTNNTPEKTVFNLSAEGPEGWTVQARPSAEQQAATVSIEGGESSTLEVSADPPDSVTAESYPIKVLASGGGQSAQADMTVEITGNLAMSLTTPTERLNAEARAGRVSNISLVVKNDGTSPLTDVKVTATPPTGWRVTFSPANIRSIAAKKSATVTARLVPSNEALAGDYVVTFTASAAGTTSDADIRVAVKASPWGGILFVMFIIAVGGGLYWVFQKYGRR